MHRPPIWRILQWYHIHQQSRWSTGVVCDDDGDYDDDVALPWNQRVQTSGLVRDMALCMGSVAHRASLVQYACFIECNKYRHVLPADVLQMVVICIVSHSYSNLWSSRTLVYVLAMKQCSYFKPSRETIDAVSDNAMASPSVLGGRAVYIESWYFAVMI